MVTSIDQLERMKTHELAELLANVVLPLRRMPNVECREFTHLPPNSGSLSTGKIPELLPPTPPTPANRKDPPASSTPVDGKEPPIIRGEPDIPPYPGADEPPIAQSKWTVADLKGKKVVELRQIAADLNLRLASGLKKDDLIAKLTTRLSRPHSEQYAIQDM